MNRSSLLCIAALAVLAPPAAAESIPQTPAKNLGHPILSLKPRPATARQPAAPRQISPAMAARLKAVRTEIAPVIIEPSSDSERGAALDIQEPTDPDVVLMDRYFVQEDRIRPIDPQHMMTPKAKRDLVLKRHPGLVLSPPAFFDVGHEILEEELAIERAQRMVDLTSMLPTSAKSRRKVVPQRGASWADRGGPFKERK